MKMNLTQYKSVVLSMALATGMAGFTFAQSSQATNPQSSSSQATQGTEQGTVTPQDQATVKQAQEQLKKDGYYTGNVDGIDGPETHEAIRKYQQSENLKVNGRLDKQTCNKLGIQQQQQ